MLETLYQLRLRLSALFRRDAAERDLDDELRYHVEELARRHVDNGVAPHEARLMAMRAMDGLEQQKESCRDTRGVSRLEHFVQDVRYGARMLRKNPSFTLVAVLALALGIGANTAIFSIVYGVLFRPLPYPDPDRVAAVYMRFSGRGVPRGTMSIADFLTWRARNSVFEEPVLRSIVADRFDISSGTGDPEQVRGSSVTAGFFSALRVEPLLGRVFGPGEDRPNSERLVVISEGLWRRRYGGDRSIVGQPVMLNGVPHTIIGVLPESFRFPPAPNAQLWTNLLIVPPTRRGPFLYVGMGRLKPGVTMEQAQAEMDAAAADVTRETGGKYQGVRFPVVPLREAIVWRVRSALLILFGSVFFVLLISAVNVANLSLSRAQAREREIALRSALGASRGRIVRQLLTESVLLSVLGGGTGLLLAYSALRVISALNPGNLPRVGDIHLDLTVLVFTFTISILTGIAFGLFPASQTSHKDLEVILKQGGKGAVGGAGRSRTHGALIVVETALSLVLLIGAGLLIRSLNRLQQAETGFTADPSKIVFAPVNLSGPRYANNNAAVQAFFDRVTEKVMSVPGMKSFTISDGLPPDHQSDNDTFVIQGRPYSSTENPSISLVTVAPGYFRTLGIPIVSGREFSESDTPKSNPVAIVSESWAKRYFPGESALGHRIKASAPDLNGTPFMEIVGVAADVRYEGMQGGTLAYYQAQEQSLASSTFLVAKPDIPMDAAVAAIRRAVHEVDPAVVVQQPQTLEAILYEAVAQPRFRTVLLATFAGLALLLAAIGIYGVIAYAVAQRSNEIGVRMALGARRGDVLRMIIGQGLKLTVIGLGIGALAAVALTRLLGDMLFAIRPTDTVTFVSTTALLLVVAIAACALPAWRAARVDPVIALRHD